MTPPLTKDELARRHLLNPTPRTLHLHGLVNQAKDGVYAKDRISNYVLGMILWGLAISDIEDWEVMLFQLPFVHPNFQRRGYRQIYERYGRPFLGPDGLILKLEDRSLEGDGTSGIAASDLDNHSIRTHANYANQLRQ